MLNPDVERMSLAAVNKAKLCRSHLWKYLIRAVLAGFFVVVATILSHVTVSTMYTTYPEFGKLLGAFFFSIAIVVIVFIGGELFTGNNMVMAMGFYNKSCSIRDVLMVWVVSYLGNLLGTILFSALFVESGASHDILIPYYEKLMPLKLAAEPMQLILRGILCNFLVCLAVLTGTRMHSESGKIVVMFCLIMTFVAAGFEHSIANMAAFSIGYLLVGGLDLGAIIAHLLLVTLGNIIGGSLLLALPLKLMSADY